jgi:hypothetical protein
MAKRRSNKPYVMTINEDGKKVFVEYDTYRELLKNLKQTIKDYLTFRDRSQNRYSINDLSNREYISVYRTKRGEWGEYFEHWLLKNDELEIIKHGWM